MLKNAKGNVIELQYNGNGQVLLTVHKSVTTFNAANAALTTNPSNYLDGKDIDRISMYIGTELENAKKTATSGTLTVAAKEKQLLETIVLSKLSTSYKEMQRNKFEVSDWKAYTPV